MADNPKNKDPKKKLPEELKDIPLTDDPFSEDHEVTEIAQAFKFEEAEVDSDEVTEVTEKSWVGEFDDDDDDEAAVQKEDSLVRKLKAKEEERRQQKLEEKKAFLKTYDKKRMQNIILIGVIACLFFGLYKIGGAFVAWLPKADPKTAQKSDKKPQVYMGPKRVDHLIKVSALEILSPKSDSKKYLRDLKKGQPMEVRFFITDWKTGPNENLGFHVDLRIYDDKGKLIHFLPKYRKFSSVIDVEKQAIEFRSKIHPKTSLKPGTYRAQYQVVDSASLKSKTLQTRFRILSR